MPGARPVNSYSPLGVGERRGDERCPARRASRCGRLSSNACGSSKSQSGPMRLDHAAGDRAGQQLAEVVVDAVVAVVEHGAGDAVVRRRTRAAVVAGRVLAVEPAGRLHFADAVVAGRQIDELVVADFARGVRRRGRDAGGDAVLEQLERDAADALLASACRRCRRRCGRDRPSRKSWRAESAPRRRRRRPCGRCSRGRGE